MGDASLNASHLKVLSVSDIDPLTLPDPTPTLEPTQEASTDVPQEQQLHATVQNISSNILTVSPPGSDSSLNIDLSQIPSYFKGGTAPGSYVSITYQGQYQENTLDGVTVTAVTGDDPDSFRSRGLTYTVNGTIIGHTSNTVTLQTGDGATITCFHRRRHRTHLPAVLLPAPTSSLPLIQRNKTIQYLHIHQDSGRLKVS